MEKKMISRLIVTATGYLAHGLVQDTAVLDMSSCLFREFKHQQMKVGGGGPQSY
jgi:hypothetical protein